MKVALKLGEEKNGLKFIQVNNGFVVVDLLNKKRDNYFVIYTNNEPMGIAKGISDEHCYTILFATPNLNLEDVPVIKNNEFFTFSKQQLRFLFDTSLHAKIGGLNQDEEFERVLIFLNKQEQTNLFTEEQVRDACLMYAKWVTGGTPSLRIAQNPSERFEQIFESLKQTKVEITFEDGKPIKCIML